MRRYGPGWAKEQITVGQLRESLAAFPDEALVVCQGTSVAVYPRRVATIGMLRHEAETNEADAETDLWAFDGATPETVIILTD